MKETSSYFIVGILYLLCLVTVDAIVTEDEVVTESAAEYKRLGSCKFTQECLYKYHTVQYTFGEKDREKIYFSTDVYWHCESSGSFDGQPANEYCLKFSNANVTFSVGFNSSTTVNHTTQADLLMDKLKGDYCYVQTKNGRIMSIHYSPNGNEEAINVKRGITGAFQANFDNKKEVEELDPGSSHVSHYSFAKTSSNVVSFTRTFKTNDLIEVTGGIPKDALDYAKTENSIFINTILYRSRGTLRTRVDFGHEQNAEPASDTFNPNFDFSDEFQANGTYTLERAYCKQRNKRSLIFVDLAASGVQKGSLKAAIDLANMDQYRMRKIRSTIPSIPGFLEKIRRNPNNTELVENLQTLVKLEAMYGTPSQYTSTLSQLIDYYKQIQVSNRPEDVEIRKIMYSLFSTDSSAVSQKILGSALIKKLNEDERSALYYQLALIRNASLDLVNTVISSIRCNDDGIILVLGALARNSNLIVQKIVVNELLKRLNTALDSSDNETLTTLIYALGNSGSQLAISPLLSTLQYEDIDIQISAIRSLASHLDQPVVQQAIITLLPLTDEDKILEEILKILIDVYENKILTNPSKELITATINSAIHLENPNLYELAAKYLHLLKIDGTDIYLDLLKQQHNYGEAQCDHISELYKKDSRVKRGSDWDESNSDFDVVASYSQRGSDVINYPYHKAYIWGRTFGVDKLNMKVGVGAFAGINISYSNAGYKFFAKAVAKVDVFGIKINVVDIEASSYASGNALSYKLYLKLGNSVDKDINEKYSLEIKNTTNIDRSKDIFYMRWPIFVYVGTVNVYIKGTVSFNMKIILCVSLSILPIAVKGEVNAKLSLNLRITGGAYASLLVIQL